MKLENKFKVIHSSDNPTICSVSAKNALAYVSHSIINPIRQNLSLCPGSFSNKIKHIEQQRKMIEKGWSMPALDENIHLYTVTHEYGHMIQNKLIYDKMVEYGLDKLRISIDYTKRTKKAIFKEYYKIINSVQKECFKEIVNIAVKNNADFKLKDNISQYGTTSFAEFFAEVFANSQMGKENELGRAMIEWLRMKGFDV